MRPPTRGTPTIRGTASTGKTRGDFTGRGKAGRVLPPFLLPFPRMAQWVYPNAYTSGHNPPGQVTTSGDKTPSDGPTDAQLEPSEASARVDALLTQLEATPDASERARILVEVAESFRDGLHDDAQALDALLEAW